MKNPTFKTLFEAKLALAQLGSGFYIYPHGHGAHIVYELRHCPPAKTQAQKQAMARTPQRGLLTCINAIASHEYHDPQLRSMWWNRWKKYQRKRSRNKKDPYTNDSGHRIDTLWEFTKQAIHWLYKTHTTDPLVPDRFQTVDLPSHHPRPLPSHHPHPLLPPT